MTRDKLAEMPKNGNTVILENKLGDRTIYHVSPGGAFRWEHSLSAVTECPTCIAKRHGKG